MANEPQKRTVWETYTLRNIRDEVVHRLETLRARPPARPAYDGSHARSVGQFYDAHHEQFMRVYGEVIQAFRTRDVTNLLDYQLRSMGLQAGQRVLDAGCGVAAPAVHFAKHAGVHVDAITVSAAQWDAARQRVQAENMLDRVTVVHGDYHSLADYFTPGAYDVVYFLESFGHSRAKSHLVEGCWDMLKPGGILYIKDLFKRVPLLPEHAASVDREIQKINDAYRYEVSSLNTVLDDVRRKGFILASLKTVDLDLEDFENLAISNEFQELTGLALIQDWNEYIFPVDFFELTCVKPEFDLAKRLDRHFLQNRYAMHAEARTIP